MNDRWTGWLLLFLLLGQALMVTLQAAGTGVSRLEGGALAVLAPVSRSVTNTVSLSQQFGENLRQRSSLQVENDRLQEENLQLHRQLQRLQELESQVRQLAEAVSYEAPEQGEYRVADVVYVDHTSWLRTLVLYAPQQGLTVDQAVLTSRGLVGRVVLVTGPYAKVQLITDRAASVGALVQRTRRQGMVRGIGDGELELAYLPQQSDVRLGDRVVTSGADGIFPRGLPIGTISEVDTGTDLFHRIRLAPAVDFGTLDHAYVLERKAVPQQVLEAKPGVRSEAASADESSASEATP